jgi:hypothetical protein
MNPFRSANESLRTDAQQRPVSDENSLRSATHAIALAGFTSSDKKINGSSSDDAFSAAGIPPRVFSATYLMQGSYDKVSKSEADYAATDRILHDHR